LVGDLARLTERAAACGCDVIASLPNASLRSSCPQVLRHRFPTPTATPNLNSLRRRHVPAAQLDDSALRTTGLVGDADLQLKRADLMSVSGT